MTKLSRRGKRDYEMKHTNRRFSQEQQLQDGMFIDSIIVGFNIS